MNLKCRGTTAAFRRVQQAMKAAVAFLFIVATNPLTHALQSSGSIAVTVNGTPVSFSDQAPAMVHQRVLVPVRGVFENLGGTVTYVAAKNLVTTTQGGKTIELYIGKTVAIVDGRELKLDQPAMVLNGRAMVPLRFLSESLGADVKWDDASKTVAISTKG